MKVDPTVSGRTNSIIRPASFVAWIIEMIARVGGGGGEDWGEGGGGKG